MRRALALAVLCGVAVACAEGSLPASAVANLRAVAAVVEVEGKAPRANPDPADMVQVSIRVIDNGPTPPLQWTLVPCIPETAFFGTPICQNVIQPCDGCEGTPPEDPADMPVVRFQVPSRDELEEAEASEVLVQGAICANGAPAGLDAIIRFITGETDELNPCEDPENEGRFLVAKIPIEPQPGDPNYNPKNDPNFNPETQNVRLNNQEWPPPYDQGVPRDAPKTGCAVDLAGLDQAVRDRHPRAGMPPSFIELIVTEESLQTFIIEEPSSAEQTLTEEMQVSWLADGGAFQRSFSFITDPARSVITEWAPPPPSVVDPGGRLVRFSFVIRDGRGGTDWVERGLCILPP